MQHKYLRHKCLRIWGEIAKLNVTECELSNWIAKINVAKSLKIWPNANIYVAKSNAHVHMHIGNLSSYIYKEFRVYKDTFIQIFPNSENFGVSFSTTAFHSRRLFFNLFLLWKKKMKKWRKKKILIRKQNRKNYVAKVLIKLQFAKIYVAKSIFSELWFANIYVTFFYTRINLWPSGISSVCFFFFFFFFLYIQKIKVTTHNKVKWKILTHGQIRTHKQTIQNNRYQSRTPQGTMWYRQSPGPKLCMFQHKCLLMDKTFCELWFFAYYR